MERAIDAIKKYLIPHKGNDHKPHLLRPRTVAFVIVMALIAESIFLFGSSSLIPRSRLFGVILVNALIDGTNTARGSDGLLSLRENPLLDAAAQEKANDMAANNYFAHTSPSGTTPWYWFEKVGYHFAIAGENLAVNFSDSADVTNAWMNSPDHRDNILNAGFTDIGMAAARGEFKGNPAIYVVELFGAPAPAFAAASSASAPAPKTAAKPMSQPAVAVATTSESSFVAIQGAETQAVQPAPVASLAATAPSVSAQANLIQRAAADPRRTMDYFYFGIALLFAIALILNVFVKIHIQHPSLIFGGMLVILIAGLFVVLNQHLGASSIVIL